MDAPEHTARLARCPRCEEPFSICKHCDRGHVYCSPRCSAEARSESLRRARRRHRQSPEGRLDHRDRERDRRRRQRQESTCVGDHPSAPADASVTVGPLPTAPGRAWPLLACSGPPSPSVTSIDDPRPPLQSCCPDHSSQLRHCSRCGAFVSLFVRPRIEAGSRTSSE